MIPQPFASMPRAEVLYRMLGGKDPKQLGLRDPEQLTTGL